MKEINLPSGAVLKITISNFEDSRNLYQAILEELKLIEVKANKDISSIIKDLICYGFSSKKIESCLDKCFKRCIYNNGKGDLKIDKDTFEPIESRDDYLTVCLEVAKENIMPFMKSLYAQYQPIIKKMLSDPA